MSAPSRLFLGAALCLGLLACAPATKEAPLAPATAGEEVLLELLARDGSGAEDFFRPLRAHLPKDALRAARLLAKLREEGASPETVKAEMASFGRELRRRHADDVARAPDAALKTALTAQLEIVEQFADTPLTCNAVLDSGPEMLSEADAERYTQEVTRRLDPIVATMAAGLNEPVGRELPGKLTVQLTTRAIAEGRLTSDEVEALRRNDPTDPARCDAMLRFLRAVVVSDLPGAEGLRALFASRMAGA